MKYKTTKLFFALFYKNIFRLSFFPLSSLKSSHVIFRKVTFLGGEETEKALARKNSILKMTSCLIKRFY